MRAFSVRRVALAAALSCPGFRAPAEAAPLHVKVVPFLLTQFTYSRPAPPASQSRQKVRRHRYMGSNPGNDGAWKLCEDEENPDRAISGCTVVVEREGRESSENLALAFSNRGAARARKGDYDGAIQDFNDAIRKNPNDAAAFSGRGNARLALNQLDQAAQDYDRAILLDPNDAAAFQGRGNTFYSQRNYGRAIQDYNEAIRLNQNFAEAYYGRGLSYRVLQQEAQAAEDLNKAKSLDPNLVPPASR